MSTLRGARATSLSALPIFQLAFVIALMTAPGCDHPALTDNGVVGWFGGVGLGPGEFSYPRAIAIAPDETTYVIDKAARVQRFSIDGTPLGVWRMPEKEQGKPVGVSVHPDGRVFVADTHYHRVVVYDANGKELTRFGRVGDGEAQFRLPTDVTFDDQGNIYVSEYGGNDRIQVFSPEFEFLRVIGDQPIEGSRFNRPDAMDMDADQTLWIADACNHRIVQLSLDGEVLTVFGQMGRDPGQMRYPYDVACDADDHLVVCEYGNHRLQWFDKQGHSLRTWGGEGRELGKLWSPWAAAIAPNGWIYIVDSYNSRVQMVRP